MLQLNQKSIKIRKKNNSDLNFKDFQISSNSPRSYLLKIQHQKRSRVIYCFVNKKNHHEETNGNKLLKRDEKRLPKEKKATNRISNYKNFSINYVASLSY